MTQNFNDIMTDLRACRHCETQTPPLPHKAHPVIRGLPSASIRIIGQAPGTRVHASGIPFDDPSGVRLRDWMGIPPDIFYDETLVAITPMGFCFPGLDESGSDRPPRRECADLWHKKIAPVFSNTKLTLVIGMYAQKYYLGSRMKRNLTETVRHWKDYGPEIIPLPHPSWRNNAWIKRYEWFQPVLAHLKVRVKALTEPIDPTI